MHFKEILHFKQDDYATKLKSESPQALQAREREKFNQNMAAGLGALSALSIAPLTKGASMGPCLYLYRTAYVADKKSWLVHQELLRRNIAPRELTEKILWKALWRAIPGHYAGLAAGVTGLAVAGAAVNAVLHTGSGGQWLVSEAGQFGELLVGKSTEMAIRQHSMGNFKSAQLYVDTQLVDDGSARQHYHSCQFCAKVIKSSAGQGVTETYFFCLQCASRTSAEDDFFICENCYSKLGCGCRMRTKHVLFRAQPRAIMK